MTVKPSPFGCVIIGDLVGSREAADRRLLHATLEQALADTDAAVPSRAGLAVTAGDEFQGAYDCVGAAIDAALRVRLALLPQVDVRFGIGRGEVTMLDADRGIQDGPGWWAARDAIEAVEAASERSATRSWRTAYRVARSVDDEVGEHDAVNAALLCRDHLIGSLSDRSVRLLRGLMEGQTQSDLADREGISASAVSQRVRADGLGAILLAHDLLRRMP